MGRGIFYILMLLAAFPLYAEPFQALDPDFFPNENNYGGPGLQTLNPDFFRTQKGLLPYAEPGTFGCVSVWGVTAQGGSAIVGKTVQELIEGQPSSIKWIPPTVIYGPYGSAAYVGAASNPYGGEPRRGHYQICGIRKGVKKSRRRPGPRP